MSDLRSYRECVRIIICKDNLVLLGERRYSDGTLMYYEFPGGGVEKNETISDTVKRESLEEVGMVVDNVRSLDIRYSYNISYNNPTRAKKYKGGNDVWCVCDFVKQDHSLHGKDGDALPYKWVPVEEAINLIKNGPPSKYNQARLEALDKVRRLNRSNKVFISFVKEGNKRLKLSDW